MTQPAGTPDTIFALSSGKLPSGVAVVRISGPSARFACETMCGTLPAVRHVALKDIKRSDGETLDKGFVVWLPAPRSFTGEDCLELHLHGGKAVVAAVLGELSSLPGLRTAEAGEFTRRAFLNNKLDLVQAEGLSDLIAAETEAQRRLARLDSQGHVGALYAGWRQRLLAARAMIEAELDFSDEADVPDSISDSIWTDVAALRLAVSAHCAGYHRSEIIRDGLDIVILGAPNAGKSSLLNALAGRDAAIVSEEAGTTRDLIEIALDVDGYKVRLTDTAGLRDSESAVEREGVTRAMSRARSADLVLFLVEPSKLMPGRPVDLVNVKVVGTKSDIGAGYPINPDLMISARTGKGITELLALLAEEVKALAPSGELWPSRQRHVQLLNLAEAHMLRSLQQRMPLEIRAEELRLAGVSLGRITGEIGVEDLLDSIFSTFCIGK